MSELAGSPITRRRESPGVTPEHGALPQGQLARWGWLLPVALFLALTLPTIGRAGIAWDEQTDLEIARSYLSGPGEWLHGSEVEPTQTRLPMYGLAVVYRLLGSQTLRTARIVSCLTGALSCLASMCTRSGSWGPRSR